jgi:hypothetical protein
MLYASRQLYLQHAIGSFIYLFLADFLKYFITLYIDEISGFHSNEYEDGCFLGYCAVYSGRY